MRTVLIVIITLFLSVPWHTSGARQRAKGTLTAATPMSCRIEGKILRTIKAEKNATGPCARYGCSALVKVLSVQNCGQSVTAPPNEGDTLTVMFEYTLYSTSKVFPTMRPPYPGLKKGSVFTANAEQRLRMRQQPGYVVYGYRVK